MDDLEVVKRPQTDLLPCKALADDDVGKLIPPETFTGALAAKKGRHVEVDPDMVFECRMAGAGTTRLPHSLEGLKALRTRLAAAARELRLVISDYYAEPNAPRPRGALKNVTNAEAVVLTDLEDAIKEAV